MSFFFSLTVLFSFESEEIGKSKFNSMIGLIDRERVDTQLYDDYETDKAREVPPNSLFIISLCLVKPAFVSLFWIVNNSFFFPAL